MAEFIIMFGGDSYVNAQRARGAVHAALKDRPDAEFMEVNASDAEPYEFDEAVSPSLLAECAVVAVANLQNASEELGEAMVAFARDKSNASVVVARHEGGIKGKRLVDQLEKAGATVVKNIPELKKDEDRLAFVNSEFRRRGRTIMPDAAMRLVGVLGANTGELAAMCGQLCFDFDDDPIDLPTAMRYLTANPQANGFEVADRALEGNAAAAIVALRDATAQGAAIPALVGAIAYKLRLLAKASAVRSGKISRGQAKAPYGQIQLAQRRLAGWTSAGMACAFEALAHADEESKTTGGDPMYALERAVELIARKGRD